MINILEIPKQKAVNNTNLFVIENYDYETFKKIAITSDYVNAFKDRVWETNSTKYLKKNKLYQGAIKFNYAYDFEFFNFYNLEAKIKERTKLFEDINWKIINQLQYQSSQELYLWEIWLEQIKWIDLRFVEALD